MAHAPPARPSFWQFRSIHPWTRCPPPALPRATPPCEMTPPPLRRKSRRNSLHSGMGLPPTHPLHRRQFEPRFPLRLAFSLALHSTHSPAHHQQLGVRRHDAAFEPPTYPYCPMLPPTLRT